ncbi:MAG TPA: hypothetical protein DIW31_02465 [Bacteroidales bacterium]|nr:hypothetical protein [Bacteroidales bacterium]
MFKNYLIISFRNLVRYKLYTILNITGLAIAIACFIFISLFIRYEFSYDQYHESKNNIYRIVSERYIGSPALLGPACEKEIPEILKTVRIDFGSAGQNFRYSDKQYFEKRFIKADPSFFEVFTFSFVKGDQKTALNDPSSIVITESTAKKYFGSEDPIGKVIDYENNLKLVVSGVIKDVPDNSHFYFDIVGQFPQKEKYYWGSCNYLTYLLLADNASPKKVLVKIGEILEKNAKQTNNPFLIQRLTDIHLYSHIRGEVGQNGFIANIYLYSIIAFIVLIMACINYTNLVTAQYAKRTKEVGVRKVFGATKRNLIVQFMCETVMFIIVAIDLALVLVVTLLPYVNNLLGKQIQISQLNGWSIVFSLVGIISLTVILAGCYPALYLSSLNPISIIKGVNKRILKGASLKKGLLIIQFSFSTFFLIFTIITSQQMNYLSNAKLGFTKEHILNISIGENIDERYETLKAELLKYPEIKQLSFNDFLLSGNDYNQNVWWEGLLEGDWDNTIRWIPVDANFVNTFELKLVQGNGFTTSKFDTGYILNEAALRITGLKDPIGKKFDIIGKGTIIGVVENYHTKSLRDSIVPCVLTVLPTTGNYLSIRISAENIPSTIRKIEKSWKNIISDRPLDYFFFDEDYNALYRDEHRTTRVFGYAALLAIIISILGLFGLLALTSEQRTKEIAIRRVLGSSVSKIFLLMNRDFIKLIIVANIITWPVVFFLITTWLQNFAYRITINWMVFIMSGVAIVALSFITVSWHSWRTSLRNPVETLRYE